MNILFLTQATDALARARAAAAHDRRVRESATKELRRALADRRAAEKRLAGARARADSNADVAAAAAAALDARAGPPPARPAPAPTRAWCRGPGRRRGGSASMPPKPLAARDLTAHAPRPRANS